ncbi:hypothetical protein HD554DRAFT_2041775 [Boletus coccyginus]|nr:hypothetical protein HD554DRAFT_2041775 [Boletus coccyginus]
MSPLYREGQYKRVAGHLLDWWEAGTQADSLLISTISVTVEHEMRKLPGSASTWVFVTAANCHARSTAGPECFKLTFSTKKGRPFRTLFAVAWAPHMSLQEHNDQEQGTYVAATSICGSCPSFPLHIEFQKLPSPPYSDGTTRVISSLNDFTPLVGTEGSNYTVKGFPSSGRHN